MGSVSSRLPQKHRQTFKGVFPCDQIPLFEAPFALVANTDPSWKGGTHWVAFFADKTTAPPPRKGKAANVVEYFDSYGLKPSINTYFTQFLSQQLSVNNFSKIVNNTRCYQSLFSNVCAHYCLMFLVSRVSGISWKTFMLAFPDSSHCSSRNDDFVVDFFNCFFSSHSCNTDSSCDLSSSPSSCLQFSKIKSF